MLTGLHIPGLDELLFWTPMMKRYVTTWFLFQFGFTSKYGKPCSTRSRTLKPQKNKTVQLEESSL